MEANRTSHVVVLAAKYDTGRETHHIRKIRNSRNRVQDPAKKKRAPRGQSIFVFGDDYEAFVIDVAALQVVSKNQGMMTEHPGSLELEEAVRRIRTRTIPRESEMTVEGSSTL